MPPTLAEMKVSEDIMNYDFSFNGTARMIQQLFVLSFLTFSLDFDLF